MYTWTPDGNTLLIFDSYGLSRLLRPTKRGGAWKIKTDAKWRASSVSTNQAGTRALVVGDKVAVLELPSLKKGTEQADYRDVGISPDGEAVLRREYGMIRLVGVDGGSLGEFPIPNGETLGLFDAALDADGCGALWAGEDLWLFDVQDMPARAIVWVDQVPMPERGCAGRMAGGQLLLWKEGGGRVRWWRIGRDGTVSARGEEEGEGFTAEGDRIAWRHGAWAVIRDLRDGREERVSLAVPSPEDGAAGDDEAGLTPTERRFSSIRFGGSLILGPREVFWLPWPGLELLEPQSGQRWARGDRAHLPLWAGLRAVQRRYNAAGAEVGVRWEPQVEFKDRRYGLRWAISGQPPGEAEDAAAALSAELIASSAHGNLHPERMESIAGFSYMSYGSTGGVPTTTGPITAEMAQAAVDRFRRHGCNWLSTQDYWANHADAWGERNRWIAADRVGPEAARVLLRAQLCALAGDAQAEVMMTMAPGELADALAAIYARVEPLGYRNGKVVGWLVALCFGDEALAFFQRMLVNGDADRYGLGWHGGTLGSDLFEPGGWLIRQRPHLLPILEGWGMKLALSQQQRWMLDARLLKPV